MLENIKKIIFKLVSSDLNSNGDKHDTYEGMMFSVNIKAVHNKLNCEEPYSRNIYVLLYGGDKAHVRVSVEPEDVNVLTKWRSHILGMRWKLIPISPRYWKHIFHDKLDEIKNLDIFDDLCNEIADKINVNIMDIDFKVDIFDGLNGKCYQKVKVSESYNCMTLASYGDTRNYVVSNSEWLAKSL